MQEAPAQKADDRRCTTLLSCPRKGRRGSKQNAVRPMRHESERPNGVLRKSRNSKRFWKTSMEIIGERLRKST